MNLAIVHSRAQLGIAAPSVTVEVHLVPGLPGMTIVGLPETAVKESKDRVRSAILNSQFEFPNRRIIVNLAPADLPKEGGRFDLPIAIGILAASKQLPSNTLDQYEFAGELALSGKLRSIKGVLPFALATHNAHRALIVPCNNAKEASLVSKLTIFPADHLLKVCAHINNSKLIPAFATAMPPSVSFDDLDLSEVHGQAQAKRAIEIAAAGGHNLLLIGPPGTGKTMLANRMLSILPPMSETEALNVASIYSIYGERDINRYFYQRPFRHPHHMASAIALVGGGNHPKPGEISLAHEGVLFLDELLEFNRQVLEVLREPLESGTITIARANYHTEFPARFQLIAAMNPCPCGYLGSQQRTCQCSVQQIQRYRAKLSGPLLDRIDLCVEVPELSKQVLLNPVQSEGSVVIRQRVIAARNCQLQRQSMANALLQGANIKKYCTLNSHEQAFLETALEKLQLSPRAYHRVIRLARTISDLANSNNILACHITEALSYHKLQRA